MLTYENVVTLLIGAAEQQRLNIALSQEQLDTHALVRTFVMTCLPRGLSEADGSHPRAAVSFRWDPSLTSISLIGSEGVCDLYHGPEEPCPHADAGCAYDAVLEVEAAYHVPIPDDQTDDIANVVGLAASTRELLAAAVQHDEDLDVRAQLVFESHGASIGDLEAVQRWVLDEELHEAQGLVEMFGEICGEVSEALAALAGHEPPPPVSSEQEEDDEDEFGDHLTYLRPPTA